MAHANFLKRLALAVSLAGAILGTLHLNEQDVDPRPAAGAPATGSFIAQAVSVRKS